MTYSSRKMAGVLFFIAVTQFVLGFIISEAMYPNYSVSDNTISDLGVGLSCIIFNFSVFLLGFLLLVGIYFLRKISDFKTVSTLLFFTVVGLMGIGVFNKNFIIVHSAMALMAFFFAGLSAISSYKVLKKPLSLISIILGMITLGALVLFIGGIITSGSLTSY